MNLLRLRKSHFLLEHLVKPNRGDIVDNSKQSGVADVGENSVATVEKFYERGNQLQGSGLEVQTRRKHLNCNACLLGTH